MSWPWSLDFYLLMSYPALAASRPLPDLSSSRPSNSSEYMDRAHFQETIIQIVIIGVIVYTLIIALIHVCYKHTSEQNTRVGPDQNDQANPAPPLQVIENGQENALPPLQVPENEQQNALPPPPAPPNLCHFPSNSQPPSSSVFMGDGDNSPVFMGFSPPPSEFDTTATFGFSESVPSTSTGLIPNGFSNAHQPIDEMETESLQLHPLTPLPSEPEEARESSHIQPTQSHSVSASELDTKNLSHNPSHIIPLPLQPLNNENGDPSTSRMACTEIQSQSLDTISTSITSAVRKDEVAIEMATPSTLTHPEPASLSPSRNSHDLTPSLEIGKHKEGEGSPCIRETSDNLLQPSPSGIFSSFSRVNLFSFKELDEATNNFSEANRCGEGSFGVVYKGQLADGLQVAIKVLKSGSRQGDLEFRKEVDIISGVNHKHLVSLLGYCDTESQRILVYEFVTNNSLRFHLHDNKTQFMDLSTRVKVALTSARALKYLLEDCKPRIIHRDIKTANILLDDEFEAKIADFGLARIFPDEKSYIETSKVMGTFGYLSPECFGGKFSIKSDVFAFGVVILELITGRRAVFETPSGSETCSLADWARPLMKSGNYDVLIDPRLRKNYRTYEMERLVACAFACVQKCPKARPQMDQIVRDLEEILAPRNLTPGQRLHYSIRSFFRWRW